MNGKLQNKLLHYEEAPPPHIWEALEAALDSRREPFAEKMMAYGTPPPPRVWGRIAAQLNENIPAPSLFVRYRRPLKFTGVAAAIILFAVLTTLLFPKQTDSSPQMSTTAETPIKPVSHPAQHTTPSHTITPVAGTPDIMPGQEISVASTGSNFFRKAIRAQQLLIQRFVPARSGAHPALAMNLKAQDDFMVYTDGNGKAMRLPKKLFDLVACPSGDNCKERLKALQEKASAASVNSGFTGILDLLHHLQDNP